MALGSYIYQDNFTPHTLTPPHPHTLFLLFLLLLFLLLLLLLPLLLSRLPMITPCIPSKVIFFEAVHGMNRTAYNNAATDDACATDPDFLFTGVCGNEFSDWTFGQCLYFMFVTMSTVG